MSKAKKKVLVVEDEIFIRELYEHSLAKSGFEVISAEDGEQGIKMAKKMPDIILLDIMLPKINGIDVLKAVKKDPETKNIPVIMLTNLGQASIIDEAFKIGAHGYLIKMRITPGQLSTEINKFLSDSSYMMSPKDIDFD